jgi:hypothetical protein
MKPAPKVLIRISHQGDKFSFRENAMGYLTISNVEE